MTSRNDCIADILKSIRDRKDRKYVEDHLEDLDSRAEAYDDMGSPRERYQRAAREMLEEHAEETAQAKRVIRMQALAYRDLRSFVEAGATMQGGSYQLSIEASLNGVNTPFYDPRSGRGHRYSAEAVSLGAQRHWIGGALEDMERLGLDDPKFAGLDRMFYSRAIEDQIFIEKVELERQARGFAASPGRTKNEHALAIARILQKWDRVKVRDLNGEGAWITEHSSWGARVIHDPDRLLGAAGNTFRRLTTREANAAGIKQLWDEARMAWAAKTLQWIDAKKMFGTAEGADKKLAEMWGGLVVGDHMKLTSAAEDPIFMNVARKVSAEREFVWKSPEAQLAYMKEFGRFNPTEAWLAGMRDSANKYGLMKMFGPLPEKNFEEILAYAKTRMTGDPQKRLFEKREAGLRNRYRLVSGDADRPIPNMMSGLVNETMRVQRMAKLGLTPFAMLADNITVSRELAYQGMGFWQRNASTFSDYFRGGMDSGKREAARLLHSGILDEIRGATARFDAPGDSRAGTMSWLENRFFKISGIQPMTRNKRQGAERMMALHMGGQKGKRFDELGTAESRIMKAFGIGEREWSLLNNVDWHTIDGQTYLTPDIATRISDADIKAYLGDRLSISERAAVLGPEAGISNAPTQVERARADLAMKLWSYYGDRANFAVIEVGAREKAILYGWGQEGIQAGSPLNNALRMMLQFKQFPTAMITKVWGREIYGGTGAMDKVAGMTELMVMGTLWGMLANYLNQLAKGQDPNEQIRNKPVQWILSGFIRGGGGTIYGDFLLGEWNRFGLPASSSLLGPTFGQIDRIAELWADITHPKALGGSRSGTQTGALATRMVRENTPFANMIWTKWAVDYLVFYRLQEAINPGYLRRSEQFMKDKQGIEFWLRPKAVQSQGFLPALGEALGGRP